jgi:hypothetical protein
MEMVLDFDLHAPTSVIAHEFAATSRPGATVGNNGTQFSTWENPSGAFARRNPHIICRELHSRAPAYLHYVFVHLFLAEELVLIVVPTVLKSDYLDTMDS